MQPLSIIIGHPEGRYSSAQKLFTEASFTPLEDEQTLQSTITKGDHTLLVYTPPGLTLARALAQDGEVASDHTLQRWSDRAQALLRQYMLNRERCTLVNELALVHTPQKVQTLLASKSGVAANAESAPINDTDTQPLMEALGGCLASSDHNSSSLYRDLEAVADINGAEALQQHQTKLRQALQQIIATAGTETEEQSAAQSEAERPHEKLQELQELQEENELLLLQLHQVQEELEHYFCEYQKMTDPASRHSIASAQPAIASAGLALDTLYDLRNEQIIGENWYDAEQDGRWAGPGTHSTLNLPAPGEGPFELVFDIVHALDINIVKHMQIRLNGEPLSLKHKFGILPIKRFPCYVSAQVPQASDSQPHTWKVEFRFPKTASPADKGGDDHRQLAIRLKSVRARAVVTPYKG